VAIFIITMATDYILQELKEMRLKLEAQEEFLLKIQQDFYNKDEKTTTDSER